MNAALVLTALFNGAWQGAVLCTLALFAFRLFPRLNATTMFTLWTVLLAIAVLLPAANYAFAPRPYVVTPYYVNTPVVRQAHHDEGAASTKPRPEVSKGQRDTVVVPPAHYDTAAASSPMHYAYVVDHDGVLNTLASISNVLRYAAWILLLVAAIALTRLAVLVRDVVRMLLARKRVRTIAAPVAISGEIAREFHFAASDEFTSPCVLGFAPPLIVIPEELLWEQSARLKSVVLHEREHVRRFDDVHNVLQRFIGAIAFFCPGVRIALRELALYREQICDDAAVNAIGDRLSYARTLTGLAQWAQGRGVPVPSLIFKRKHLVHRLEVLLDSAVSHSLRMNRRFAVVAVTAVVVAAMLVLRIQLPVIAETETQQVHQQMAKVRADIKQLHVQAQKVSKQVQTARVQAKVMHAQVQTMRVQAKVVRTNLAKVHVDAAKVRAEVKDVREEVRPLRLHLHTHAFARRAFEMPRVRAFAISPEPPVAGVAPAIVGSASGDLLDALNAAGMHNLSVDDLVALRDHGVSGNLVRSAMSYFGHVSAQDLVNLADHGVGSTYIATLNASGVRGITPDEAIKLMDHGVSAPLINEAFRYFPSRPSAEDLTYLSDHGVTALCLQAFRAAGLNGVAVRDIVRLVDNGVEGAYVSKVRRMMPRASIDDIIRLHNAGF